MRSFAYQLNGLRRHHVCCLQHHVSFGSPFMHSCYGGPFCFCRAQLLPAQLLACLNEKMPVSRGASPLPLRIVVSVLVFCIRSALCLFLLCILRMLFPFSDAEVPRDMWCFLLRQQLHQHRIRTNSLQTSAWAYGIFSMIKSLQMRSFHKFLLIVLHRFFPPVSMGFPSGR